MNFLASFFSKAENLFQIPNTILLGKIFLVAIFWQRFYQQVLVKHKSILLILFLGVASWHFGLRSTIQALLIAGGAFLFGVRVLKVRDYLFAGLIGFMSFVQIFAIVALISNVTIGYYSTLMGFWILALVINRSEKINFKNFLNFSSLNIFDWALIFTTLIFGSLPQMHWDAIQANLYIAKWYVLSNSLNPILESLTSLFPQSAMVYYAVFFKTGGLKMLQLAFFLPFLFTLLIVKKVFKQTQVDLVGQAIGYLAFMTPIMIFQASNGYYDNLVLTLLLAAGYVLFVSDFKNVLHRSLLAAFLIGFAIGSKYFPLVMAPLPVLAYLISTKLSFKSILPVIVILALTFGPLGLWLARTYLHTGSPVFPFFQNYFPTPKFWDATDRLEANFMIQTTMNLNEWVKGGFLTYPLKSYLNSSQFIEGTKGYPSFLYLALIPFEALFLVVTLIKLIRRKQLSREEGWFLYAFFMYFGVGLVVRYYRYLWPFQFIWLLTSSPLLSKLIASFSKFKIWILLGVCLLIPIQFINLIEYYRYYPPDKTKLFHADYYLSNTTDKTPTAYINSHTSPSDLILDGSKFPVMRFHFKPKVYQCSWYWTDWASEIKKDQVLNQFRYLIANDPISLSSNYCSPSIQKAVANGNYNLVYQDGTYTIYEKNQL